MKLTVFNGSPKLGANNTQLLTDALIAGMNTAGTHETHPYRLNRLTTEEAVGLFLKAEAVLIAFPLYAYAMPPGVMDLFEALEPHLGKCSGKKLGFLVQYGFREAVHARPLERYLEKLSARLGCDYLGTVIKGGCDALSTSPPRAFKAVFDGIRQIGATLGQTGRFDAAQLAAYARPESVKPQAAWLTAAVVYLINRFYWAGALKKNGITVTQSFARPYESSSGQ